MINELAKKIHANNIAKGFYEKEKNVGEMLALIHSEVSEALEADRAGKYYSGAIDALIEEGQFSKPDVEKRDDIHFKNSFEICGIKNSFEDELADIMIRVMDLAAFKGIDLEAHIKAKMRYNSLREKYHGKKY